MQSASKKILILSTRFPFPLMGGDRIRIYNICKSLAKEYNVDLLVISEEQVEQTDKEELEKLGIRVIVFSFSASKFNLNAAKGLFGSRPLQVVYYYFQVVRKWFDAHIAEYDIVLCNHIRTAEYLRDVNVKKIIDLHDAISLNYSRARRFTSGLWKWIYTIENKRVLPYELQAIRSFDLSLIVSQVDKDFLCNHGASQNKIRVLPVAVDPALFQRPQKDEERDWIVFVGKMNTVANSDAAVYFATTVFPQIQLKMPKTEFYIVGADPTPKVQALSKIQGVHVTGRVDDHLAFIEKAMVVVDPMRFGAGMQNKVLEAMALGKSVVASTLATEGIEGKHGTHFLVADSVDNIVNAVVNLFSDFTLRRRLGNNAVKLVREKYSWDVVGQLLLDLVRESFKFS